jgi:hypothetical protein
MLATVKPTLHFTSIDTIRDLYRCGYSRHWFDAGATEFFRTRYPQGGYTTKCGTKTFFVTSEKGPHGPRAYTVRALVAPYGYTRLKEIYTATDNIRSNPALGAGPDTLVALEQERASLKTEPWEVETIEPFNGLSKSVANRTARDLATGKLVMRHEDYKYVARSPN